MEVRLELSSRPGWQRYGHCWWRGYAFIGDAAFDPATLATRSFADAAEARALCHALNGCFALVYQEEAQAFAAVDIIRSIPILYRRDGSLITDQLTPGQVHDPDTQWLAANGWARQEYLPGDRTIDRQMAALQAGELLWLDRAGYRVVTYYDHQRRPFARKDFNLLSQEFLGIIERFTQRLIRHAARRPIVVLLSGGYDSRLLLAALHRADYRPLRAVTYGLKGSEESRLASQVAHRLGVAHEFVAYTPALISRSWRRFSDYAHFAGKGISVPQEQDYFALWQLRQRRALDPQSLIVPGFCGDLQAGSYVPLHYFALPGRLGATPVGDWLIHRLTRWPVQEGRRLLAQYLPTSGFPDQDAAIAYLERWFIRERVAKYTVNGVRAYEQLGYAWYLPLWDREFVDFWQGVPNTYRRRMQLYRETLRHYLFAPSDIDFPEDRQRYTWRQHLREFVPAGWRANRQARHFQANTNGLDAVTDCIAGELALPYRPMPVNTAMGYYWQQQWIKNDI